MAKNEKQFSVIIQQGESGYLVATVPALPGCYTQAKTLPVLRKRIKEAILLCLDVGKNDPQYRRRITMTHEPSFVGLEMVSA